MKELWRQFGFALTFLTRIPGPGNINYDSELPAKAMFFYPLVGIILGGILVIADILLGAFITVKLRSLILLIMLIYITGGLHLDGFMDMVDGFFSGRKRDRILEIMHDSRVGAFGVIGVVLLILLKYGLLQELKFYRRPVLLLFPAVSRWLVVIMAGYYPVTAGSKLGRDVNQKLGRREQASFLWPLLLVLTFQLSGLMSLGTGILLILVAVIFTLLFARRSMKLIGGMTGDIYGALIEMSEVVILLAAVVIEGIL